MQVKITCRDLSFSYPGSDGPIFSGLNLSFSGPGFFSFFGFSGSGKSTLARLIGGLLAPDKGQVVKQDLARDLFSYNTERLPGWKTVKRHLEEVTAPERRHLLHDLLSEFGVESFAGHKFPRLSMGQKNRVNLIRYLVQDFDLLILDEVLANVDEPSRNMILSFIKEHYPEQTFIYISHNVSEVALFSKKIFVLQEAGTSGLSSLVSIPGLDIKHPRQAERSRAQEKILEILRAASSKDWQDTE